VPLAEQPAQALAAALPARDAHARCRPRVLLANRRASGPLCAAASLQGRVGRGHHREPRHAEPTFPRFCATPSARSQPKASISSTSRQ
jgi:hypothetical protein